MYLSNNNNQLTNNDISVTNSIQPKTNRKIIPPIAENNSNSIQQKTYNNQTVTNNTKNISLLQEKISEEVQPINIQKETSTENAFTIKKAIVRKKKNSTIIKREVLNTPKKIADGYLAKNSTNNTGEQLLNKATLTTKEKDTTIAVQKEKKQDSCLTTNNSSKSVIISKKNSTTKKSILSNFEISVTGAADITTVKFKKSDALSTAFGFGITYFINKKISIGTGIGIAQKLYNADSVDYKKIFYLPWYSRLTNIAANCRVIEVPINIQYNLKAKGNVSWTAVAGVSNYFMKSEDYVYEYTVSGVPKTIMYSYSNKNNHLLSIVNLSLAYRRTINTQWSWQLAPFAKIPLTGVGEGKVQLSSIGLQGSIHFKLKK
jgi:hypothetical protein